MTNSEKQYAVDERYLKMAFVWACNSKAFRRKVGALMVKDGMIISDGYNGTPSGMCNCCEDLVAKDGTVTEFKDYETLCSYVQACGTELLKTRPEVLHAESNAISKVSASSHNSRGATIYVTDMPCMECSKMIIQCGISRVVYARKYSDERGVELLRRNGVSVEEHPIHISCGMLTLV